MNLLIDNNALTEKISDEKWGAFQQVWDKANSAINLLNLKQSEKNIATPSLEQRGALTHLWGQHLKGYVPIAEFVFLSDADLKLAHTVVLNHVYKDINRYGDIPCIHHNNPDILLCALQYDVIPEVTKFLQKDDSCSEQLNNSIREIFNTFSQRFSVLGDEAVASEILSTMLWKNTRLVHDVSGQSNSGFAQYRFGKKNDQARIEVLSLVEDAIKSVVLKSPLKPNLLDVNSKAHIEYGSKTEDPIAAKIALYVQSVDLVRTARELIREQHTLFQSPDAFSQQLATLSNNTFTVAAFQKFLDAQDKTH